MATGEAELVAIIRDVNAQYAALFAQVITINFAMIVAVFYFLHRAPMRLKLASFVFYAVGMLTLIGLMLQQANLKALALKGLAALPENARSTVGAGLLVVNEGWLFTASRLFLNCSLWVLFAVIAYLLFWWKGEQPPPPPNQPTATD
ncbi:MAG: hypothetical protein ACKO1N_05265 [Erythrobacter sp.]